MLAVQVIALLSAAYMARVERCVMVLTLPALACVAAAHWNVAPDNWHTLRLRWELSHALGAILQLLGFYLLVIAVPLRGRRYTVRSYFY